MYAFNIAYNIHKGNEFMLYGENLFILVQNALILYLFKVFDNNVSTTKLIKSSLIYTVIVVPVVL